MIYHKPTDELPKRKNIRPNGYDYSRNGTYFITICVINRLCVLSKICVGEGFPLPLQNHISLSDIGVICENMLKQISDKYPNVFVDSYVIMPNHIHILFTIKSAQTKDGRGNPSPTISSVIGWYKYQTTKELSLLFNTETSKLWQRSYYDHIIRNIDEYNVLKKYIYDNPFRWSIDELNPQNMR